jgi:ubiquitin carboxyl-terminal hydrolase L3
VTSDDLVFFPQTIGNACGTIALFHALGNAGELVDYGKGTFADLMKSIDGKPHSDISKTLENDQALAAIHEQR